MKGIADKETIRLINSTIEHHPPPIPRKFWCYDSLSKKEACCWWHFVFYPNGGPERDGIYHPCYEYETDVIETLDKHKCIAVFKATGLGLTELVLLWILWKCHTDPFFRDKEAIIITGPNVDLAQDLIMRAKKFLFNRDLPYIDQGVYELTVNRCRIKCYPSNNIHSARGKPKVSVFFGDEAAFFKIKNDSIVRTVGERYIGKSNSWVIWVSTAGEEPAGFFYDILTEEPSIYQKRHFYVEAGLKQDPDTRTSIFSPEFLEKASEARSYEREYLGIWGSNVGDVFSTELLDEISKEDYPFAEDDTSNDRILGVDPGFGSSEFGIVAMQKYHGKKAVIAAESYQRASYIDMLDRIDKLCKRFHITRIFVDASFPEGIKDLRDKYHYNVTPIAFGLYGERMLNYAANHVSEKKVLIHPAFKKLKSQLMTIKLNKKGLPDKNNANPFDLGDAFLLALWYYKMGSGFVAGVN